MKNYKFRIRGTTPLMQHRMTEEQLFGLLGAKSSKKKTKEELTPRELAVKHVYRDDQGRFYIPSEFISGAFSHVAGDYKQKNSIRKSIKAIANGVFRPVGDRFFLEDENGLLSNFEVDVRRATNHGKGAVAVCRPRFDRWEASGEVAIDTTLIDSDTVLEMLNDSGKRSGIGSFRVSRGGYFGQFVVTLFEESK